MKTFVNPLFWFFVLQLFLLCFWLPRNWRMLSHNVKFIFVLVATSSAGLLIFSLPVTSLILKYSLILDTKHDDAIVPTYIFVLGGGYSLGETKFEDNLGGESYRRVLRGIELWRQFPKSKLVFAGASTTDLLRSPDRIGKLSVNVAKIYNIPAEQIVLETKSMNTREHPIEAIKLPGVTPELPIAIVTSDWHLRRARQEFKRYFFAVKAIPASAPTVPFDYHDFIPTPSSLSWNMIYLQEWIGILWYSSIALAKELCTKIILCA